MSGTVGRKVTFEWNSANIAGTREKSASCNGTPVNVTSDESTGWQELLTDPGEDAVSISLSGVTKDTTLRSDWYGRTRTRTAELGYPDGGTIGGTFYLANYNEGLPYNDAITFEAELQSSGEITYTPPAAPTNSILPAVSGIPQVGETLTALPGAWTGAPTSYTYQWQVDDGGGYADISGATSQTYDPIVGNVGYPHRVQVTAVNAAGSLEATSGPTADLLAA